MHMKKKAAAAYREPLFDRLFKPEIITLPNGHTVKRPRSRMPLITIVLIAVVWASIQLTGFDIAIIIKRGHQFTYILNRIFHPNFEYFPKVVGPLMDTIKMSILGSVLGATLPLPFAVRLPAMKHSGRKIILLLQASIKSTRKQPAVPVMPLQNVLQWNAG